MTLSKTGNKAESESRFEFRSFGQDFDTAHYRMSRLSAPVNEKFRERVSEEVYIISRSDNKSNIKVRDGNIDVKQLIQTAGEFEQWAPLMKESFPVRSDLLQNDVFPWLRDEISQFAKPDFTFRELLSFAQSNHDLLPVYVKKKRFGYMINEAISEFGLVWINGALIYTVSVESTDIEKIKKTLSQIDLTGVENINYIKAIKRITGIIDKPLPNP